MKANELRIGNYVTIDNPEYRPRESGLIMAVQSIDTTALEKNDKSEYIEMTSIGLYIMEDNLLFDRSFGQKLEYLKPIPLTEELILKCGFKVYVYNNMFENTSMFAYKSLMLCFHNKKCFLQEWDRDKEVYVNVYREIKYLHQLQNLVFALTKTELKEL